MQYYKDLKGGIHFLESEASEYLLPAGTVRISDQEAQEIIAAAEPVLSERDQLLMQIVELEATVTQRRLREAALGTDDGWLRNLDQKIAGLRAKL